MVQELFTPVTDPRPDLTLEQVLIEAQNPESEWNQAEQPHAQAAVNATQAFGYNFDLLDGNPLEIKRVPEHGEIVEEYANGNFRVCIYEGETSSRCDLRTPKQNVNARQLEKWEAKKAEAALEGTVR